MDTWAKAAPEDRAALFNQTAVTRGISPEIIEKDFWVCWTLHQVFQFRDFPRLIFKGGTSLSKAGSADSLVLRVCGFSPVRTRSAAKGHQDAVRVS